MEIQITATEKITQMEGVAVRLWEGITASGKKCKVFVHRVAVHNSEDCCEFEVELKEQMPPSVCVDLRSII